MLLDIKHIVPNAEVLWYLMILQLIDSDSQQWHPALHFPKYYYYYLSCGGVVRAVVL